MSNKTLMSSPSSVIGTSGVKAALSTVTLMGGTSYFSKTKFTESKNLMKGAYQFVSSMAANTIKGAITPMLPEGVKTADMYLEPMIVGGSYAVMAYFLQGDKAWLYNFLLSDASEMIAQYVEAPVEKLLKLDTGGKAPLPIERPPHRGAIRGPSPQYNHING